MLENQQIPYGQRHGESMDIGENKSIEPDVNECSKDKFEAQNDSTIPTPCIFKNQHKH